MSVGTDVRLASLDSRTFVEVSIALVIDSYIIKLPLSDFAMIYGAYRCTSRGGKYIRARVCGGEVSSGLDLFKKHSKPILFCGPRRCCQKRQEEDSADKHFSIKGQFDFRAVLFIPNRVIFDPFDPSSRVYHYELLYRVYPEC